MVKLNNGVEIPQFGLGVFRSTPGAETSSAVQMAIEEGYRHIDTAQAYENEKDVALGLKNAGIKREEVFITSKVAVSNILSRRTYESVMRSLEALDTDYIDLFLIHWPATNYLDAWEALIKLYEEKRFRAIGVSNFEPHQLKVLEDHGLMTPAVNQIELHPKFQQKIVKPYCENKGIVIEAWSPLGGRDNLLINEPVILKIADKHGKTGAQVILRWHLQTGNVVIPKSVRRERIIENSKIFDFVLDEADMKEIAALDTGKRIYWDPNRWER